MLELFNLSSNFSFIFSISLSLYISPLFLHMDDEITGSMSDHGVLSITPVALLIFTSVSKQHFLVTTPRSQSIVSGQIT